MLISVIAGGTIIAYIAMLVTGAASTGFDYRTREYRLCWRWFLATAGMVVAGIVAICLIICKYGCPAG